MKPHPVERLLTSSRSTKVETGRARGGRPARPTRAELAAAAGCTIPDVIDHGLRVLFVGINPSLYSAAVGHHFARPGNRFWPALDASRFTDRLLSPWEDRQLVDYGCGLTNLVERATARADQIPPAELAASRERLVRKINRYHVGCVAVLGVTAFRAAFGDPRATIGRQEQSLGKADLWVLPNPSGLNAHYQLPDFARLFSRLRKSLR